MSRLFDYILSKWIEEKIRNSRGRDRGGAMDLFALYWNLLLFVPERVRF